MFGSLDVVYLVFLILKEHIIYDTVMSCIKSSCLIVLCFMN